MNHPKVNDSAKQCFSLYGRDGGSETVATYHIAIRTVKLLGSSV